MAAAHGEPKVTIEANGLHFQYQEWGDTRTKHALITAPRLRRDQGGVGGDRQ